LLGELLRQPNAPPLLLLGSYRIEYGDSPCLRVLLAAGSARSAELRFIDVGTLEPAEAHALALSILGPGPGSAELAEQIARESGGHPYLVTELASNAQTSAPGLSGLSLDAVLWTRVAVLQALRIAVRCSRECPERRELTSRQVTDLISYSGLRLVDDTEKLVLVNCGAGCRGHFEINPA
jgi:hypothetical protein